MTGRDKTRMVSFPASVTLSAIALLPKSFKSPALNSVRYPIPTIFKRILMSPFSIPVIPAIEEMMLTVFCSMSATKMRMMTTPVTVTAKESSGLLLFSTIAATAVTNATPMILKISMVNSSACPAISRHCYVRPKMSRI